jgi:hypothetical protein
MKYVFSLLVLVMLFFATSRGAYAQRATPRPTLTPTPEATEEAVLATAEPTPDPPRVDLTQTSEEAMEPLEKLLHDQELGPMWPKNPIKYAIRSAVKAGVPVNTVVLLLLLPVVAAFIAAARHIIGLRGFGIFLPAALSVVFVAIGPIFGLLLFFIIVGVSTVPRFILRKLRVRLQYLPRMALMLWFVVLGVLGILFTAPFVSIPGLTSVSIFPVLILVLLSEEFSKVQLGKSAHTAINMTIETLILALICFIFLTVESLQSFALLNPEYLLIGVAIFDFLVGKFIGLRLVEYWRFRKLVLG